MISKKIKCNFQQNYAAETMGGVQGGPKHAKKAKIHEKTQKSRAVFFEKSNPGCFRTHIQQF